MTLKMKIDEEREEARLEGIAIGLAKGAHDAKVETAKVLLENGVDSSLVSKSTGLTAEEIRKINK